MLSRPVRIVCFSQIEDFADVLETVIVFWTNEAPHHISVSRFGMLWMLAFLTYQVGVVDQQLGLQEVRILHHWIFSCGNIWKALPI
jgi:hypothetical protein